VSSSFQRSHSHPTTLIIFSEISLFERAKYDIIIVTVYNRFINRATDVTQLLKERLTLILTEPIIETYTDLPAAIHQEHQRLSIASAGVTPSKGMIAEATLYAHDHEATLSVWISPNAHSFAYTDPELKIMEADLLEAQQLGADAAIFSALTPDHQLDTEAMTNLIAAAGGMTLSFANGIDDMTPEVQTETITWLADHDFERVYASGHADQQTADLSRLQNLCTAAGIQLVALNVNDATELEAQLGITTVAQSFQSAN
jgi:copper homeostasis protein